MARAGANVRCWDCRNEIVAPLPNLRGRLAREMCTSIFDALSAERVQFALVAATLLTCALLLGRTGGLLAGAAAVAGFVYACRASIRTSAAWAWSGIRRHRAAMLVVLFVLPVALVTLEAVLVGLSYEQGWLRYLVLDIPPQRATVDVLGPHPSEAGGDFETISDANVLRIYVHGLRHGYAMTWAIPASLMRRMSTRPTSGYALINAAAWEEFVNPATYLAYRVFLTITVLTSIILLFSLQARWITLIGSVEARFLTAAAAQAGAALAANDKTAQGMVPPVSLSARIVERAPSLGHDVKGPASDSDQEPRPESLPTPALASEASAALTFVD
jgi:hypothetical protein